MYKYWLIAIGSAWFLGCEPQLASISAGHVGCVPADIQVSDYESVGMNGASWVAECKGRMFACSGSGNTVSCAPIGGEPAPAPASNAHAPGAPSAPATTADASRSRWVRQRIDQCGVEAEFPAEPRMTTKEFKTGSAVATAYIAVADQPEEWAVLLTCAKVPTTETKSFKKTPYTKVIDDMRDGALKAVDGEFISEHPIIGGREVAFAVEGKPARVRFFVVDDKVVSAMVTPVSGLGSAKTDRFFRSVELSAER